MASQARKKTSNDRVRLSEKVWYQFEQEGDIVADKSWDITAPFDGFFESIGDLFQMLGNMGADASNPLNMGLDVTINGVTIFSTLPLLDKTAADGLTTLAAATGVTVGVLKTAETDRDFVKGDLITITANLTRTASPGDEMADQRISVALTPYSDFDPDITVNQS